MASAFSQELEIAPSCRSRIRSRFQCIGTLHAPWEKCKKRKRGLTACSLFWY